MASSPRACVHVTLLVIVLSGGACSRKGLPKSRLKRLNLLLLLLFLIIITPEDGATACAQGPSFLSVPSATHSPLVRLATQLVTGPSSHSFELAPSSRSSLSLALSVPSSSSASPDPFPSAFLLSAISSHHHTLPRVRLLPPHRNPHSLPTRQSLRAAIPRCSAFRTLPS